MKNNMGVVTKTTWKEYIEPEEKQETPVKEETKEEDK